MAGVFDDIPEAVKQVLVQLPAVQSLLRVTSAAAALERVYVGDAADDGSQNPPRISVDVEDLQTDFSASAFHGPGMVSILIEWLPPEEMDNDYDTEKAAFRDLAGRIWDQLTASYQPLTPKGLNCIVRPDQVNTDWVPPQFGRRRLWGTAWVLTVAT